MANGKGPRETISKGKKAKAKSKKVKSRKQKY
jgi:hypothetical protein